ncbi:MAG: competence protein CoiA family protein [Bacteroidales bacterium]|nr:competence protein CoiA family protein [Bacteroidales bacterium]
MANIRYRTAYDENGNLIDIKDVLKEERDKHTYYCITCGEQLLPRLGDERARHFYHKKDTICDGESYLHKLAKLRLKEKFDKSQHFYISYRANYICNNEHCKLRNDSCIESIDNYQIDLKEYYDKATIESPIKEFIADVLLTNSKDSKIPPILLEIRVTHACEQEKLDSKLKIIEFHVKKESDINILINQNLFKESFQSLKGGNIFFYSFNRDIKKRLISEVNRYILNKNKLEGYFCKIPCDKANFKLRSSSILELNVVNKKNYCNLERDILYWLFKYERIRRCRICKYYFSTGFELHPKCRLDQKYGTPTYPKMDYAEGCRFFKTENYYEEDLKSFYIEKVTNIDILKPEFKVIIVYEKDFDNYELFRDKCDHFLKSKLETSNVVLISRKIEWIDTLCKRYAEERNIQIENHPGDWNTSSRDEEFRKRDEEVLSIGDVALIFWSGKTPYMADFIRKVEEAKIIYRIIKTTE